MFRNTRPDDMLAHMCARRRPGPGVDVNRIDDAIIGCAMPEAEQGMNVARIGVLLAGLPNTIAAQTVNRLCSGLQAWRRRRRDPPGQRRPDAGGTESMSMVPMMGNKIAMAPSVFDNDHVAIAYGMGITAEKVAEEWKVSREDQDAFALASHQKAMAAIQNGEFKDEISPYEIVSHLPDLADGQRIITRNKIADTDEGPRPDSSAEGLAKLRPVFRNGQFGGTVTAGNSSQMSDGAGAVLRPRNRRSDYGLTPLARFVSFGGRVRPSDGHRPDRRDPEGTEAGRPDPGPAGLDRAQQPCRVAGGDPRLDPAKVNPLGARDCPGPPAGATGAIRTATLLHGLRRRQQKRHGDHVHRHRHGRGGFRGAVRFKALPADCWLAVGPGWVRCPHAKPVRGPAQPLAAWALAKQCFASKAPSPMGLAAARRAQSCARSSRVGRPLNCQAHALGPCR